MTDQENLIYIRGFIAGMPEEFQEKIKKAHQKLLALNDEYSTEAVSIAICLRGAELTVENAAENQ